MKVLKLRQTNQASFDDVLCHTVDNIDTRVLCYPWSHYWEIMTLRFGANDLAGISPSLRLFVAPCSHVTSHAIQCIWRERGGGGGGGGGGEIDTTPPITSSKCYFSPPHAAPPTLNSYVSLPCSRRV